MIMEDPTTDSEPDTTEATEMAISCSSERVEISRSSQNKTDGLYVLFMVVFLCVYVCALVSMLMLSDGWMLCCVGFAWRSYLSPDLDALGLTV